MRKKKIAQIKELYHNPGKSADYIGLRYSLDSEPGYTRKKHGTGFTYKTPDGKTVKDSKLKKYFKTLVIPPAWTDVWINPHKNGHILVTGRDADGRKQYMYHPKWQELRTKLNSYRMIDFAEQLPKIRHKVDNEINKKGLSEDKISALIRTD